VSSNDNHPRLGGELPTGSDPLSSNSQSLPLTALAFSHGRAAITWLVHRNPSIRKTLVCGYTCPTVPIHLRRLGLEVNTFDVGCSIETLAALAKRNGGSQLVLLPALFGRDPWLDPQLLSEHVGPGTHVMIDAAQTAFGHVDYVPPRFGSVLSVPRKSCALGGLAWLRMSEPIDEVTSSDYRSLPVEKKVGAGKRLARDYFANGNLNFELDALKMITRYEDAWPDGAHRADEIDIEMFLRVDPKTHRECRRRNAAELKKLLCAAEAPIRFPDGRAGKGGVPFNFPVLLPSNIERGALLKELHKQRLFATPLWPAAECDPKAAPLSDEYRQRLITLPVDQRFNLSQINQIAEIFVQCLSS